jgi:hypothetical protein
MVTVSAGLQFDVLVGNALLHTEFQELQFSPWVVRQILFLILVHGAFERFS